MARTGEIRFALGSKAKNATCPCFSRSRACPGFLASHPSSIVGSAHAHVGIPSDEADLPEPHLICDGTKDGARVIHSRANDSLPLKTENQSSKTSLD